MEVFLPIAQVFINPIEILLLSAIVGVLSGLFGVGGGFLMTPFLIFMGVPPAYAVANEANNILATSVSGSTTHWLKNTLDYKMGFMIVIGGSIGTALGIYTFTYFKGIGKIDTVISLAYMYILAIIGTLMLVESLGEIDKAKKNVIERKKLHVHYWIHGLPFRMRFPKSKLYESVFTPIMIGLVVGFIAAIMGIGGAFILVPAMIYIIKMPTKLVPGTSLFVTIFVSVIVTFLHSINFGSIDLMLVVMLVVGSIVGVQVGQKLGEQIDSSGLKALLALLLLIVGIIIAYDTFFVEEIQKETIKSLNQDLNFFSKFIKEFSKDMPFFYGLFSILFAVSLGIAAAFIRRFISNFRKKYFNKTLKQTK
ncbi:TSUP family transporter [Pelagibacterales bacterium SAG-MED09]|nr:TSUP family transporter [Pelagibacterales bacterium SAG-MED09]